MTAVAGRSRTRAWLTALVRDLSPNDWLIVTYFGLLVVAVSLGEGPNHDEAAQAVVGDTVFLLVGLALTRGEVLARGRFASSLLYRLTLFLPVFSSYFQLRVILPAAAPRSVDASLYAADLAVFHFEPSLAWDRFVTPWTTEWFAFFYFSNSTK